VVIERDADFARLLRHGLPARRGAQPLCLQPALSCTIEALSPVTLVSSLPLAVDAARRSKASASMPCSRSLRASPARRLIQYTYAAPHLRPFNHIPPGWHWRRAASVWANLPPATVWSLERTPGIINGIH
jgi:phosphatidylethanolamine/phosphatidyl-N-methylethanolamine N-methyltransferase